MVKIAITGGKGGVGKSMVSISLAVEFARELKTMLIDADTECPNDHLLLSIKRKEAQKVFQLMPVLDRSKCRKCGECAQACKQNAIIFVKGRYPVFVKDNCIGCMACKSACPYGAISESKREIGTIYTGEKYGINLVSGELKLGELASGEVVKEVRRFSEKSNQKLKAEVSLIDSAPGIGCPVIASLVGVDYIVAVTEPTPSALLDLKRVLYLADHFKIKRGIVINKFDLTENFYKEIEKFAIIKKIPILGKIPYRRDFIQSTIQMKPVVEINSEYQKLFQGIIKQINIKLI